MYEIYWNSRKKQYSIKNKSTNKVCGYTDKITLRNPRFKVSQSGRARALATNQKNVHATILGTEAKLPPSVQCIGYVFYDPYKYSQFNFSKFGEQDSTAVLNASYIKCLVSNGKAKMYLYEEI